VIPNWLYRHLRLVVASCVVVVLSVIVSTTAANFISRSILDYFNNWSLALSAGATLVLACVAFISIRENRRIREEDRKRQFRAESLNEISRWAREGIESCVRLYASPQEVTKSKLQLEIINAESGNIVTLSRVFGNNRLISAVKKAADELMNYANFLNGQQSVGNPAQMLQICKDSFINALKATVKLKVEETNMTSYDYPRQKTPDGEPTLSDIIREVKSTKKSMWITPAAFGGSLVLLGASLWLQQIPDTSPWITIGFFISIGIGFMVWCLYMVSRTSN